MKFDGTTAVKDASFSVQRGDFASILGPSGSGKTTVLRCLAGVEHPYAGEIELGGKLVYSRDKSVDLPPESRGIGMVYQNLALWPHMTVFENIAYPLRVRGEDAELEKKVANQTEMLKMVALKDRYPSELSGGEQQRVALARALIYDPSLVLLDEPFSNLDLPLREELGDDLKMIQRSTGTTMIYVTHDKTEATTLSDVLIVMSEGSVMSQGGAVELLEHPPDPYTAAFLGGMLVLDANVSTPPSGPAVVQTVLGSTPLQHPPPRGGRVRAAIPPSALTIRSAGHEPTAARVRGLSLQKSGDARVRLEVAGQIVRVALGPGAKPPVPGDYVELVFDPAALRIFSD
jgi:iron(III) transport system ATP-binding protein